MDEFQPHQPRLSGKELDRLETASHGLAGSENRRALRIAIVTENFLPKVDGVTRTLARLLEHLRDEGHEAIICGPSSEVTSYAGFEVVGTKGIPLLGVYKGLKLNFIRPRFISKLLAFEPNVIHFVDPIWLGAQCIPAIRYWLPSVPFVASYHTNLAMYATLFGFAWLTPTMWNLQRYLHSCCRLTFCPSPSTARSLEAQRFNHVRLWPRGVDIGLFRPSARNRALRVQWGAEASLELPVATIDDLPTYDDATCPFDPDRSRCTILYVGRLSWEKNLRLLVEAFRGLQEGKSDESRPPCRLVFVGEGPSRGELERMCQRYGIDAVFMGYRTGEELAACYGSADIFAFPSWTETYGQVVSEALASGLPVVGLKAEGVCDLVEHGKTGLLLDLNDLVPTRTAVGSPKATSDTTIPANAHELVNPDGLTFPIAVSIYRSLLADLAGNHVKRQEMGALAAQQAVKRSWHSAMEMLVTGYREVAKSSTERPSSLSRVPTLDLDVVSHATLESPSYSSEAVSVSARSKRPRVEKMLRMSGLLQRSGRLREGSISRPLRTWLTGASSESPRLVPLDSIAVGKRSPSTSAIVTAFRLLALACLLVLICRLVSVAPQQLLFV